ncbi:hypothetical protein [Salinispora arenicola]|uniref:hypothetical protein n=1 Tax=Salinispora arenicola TaxID=168697 RepID=UPI00036627DF|nr:hypothetical protein [Salinispora arenicola]
MSEQTLPGAVVTPHGRYPGQIIGYRRSGAPIRVVAGGSGQDAPAGGDSGGDSMGGDSTTETGTTPDPTEQQPAGPADAGSDTTVVRDQPTTSERQQTDSKPASRQSPPSKRPLEEFPDDIRDYVKDLRKQAGDGRVGMRTEKERADTAEGRLQEVLEGFTQVLGLTPQAPQDEPQDPAQVAAQLTEQLSTAREEHRKTRIEMATFLAAQSSDADARALLDSRSFGDRVSGLDLDAPDFAEQLATAIREAVEENPKFRSTTLLPHVDEPPSGGQFSGGPGGQPAPESMSVEDHLRVISTPG